MNEKPCTAANCANGYIYDSTCEDCAAKDLACTKSCFEFRICEKDRLERCQSGKHMILDTFFTAETEDYPICKIIGTYCRKINSCDDFKSKDGIDTDSLK